ncbi:MAG: HAMP domain-containing sensor histidine kinase [Candidatus Cohnella colombiensis]|uniref:histidine kinase n=1 Tax=Candidatus Cohnella colombiensis TaxID=3121368 RepID=A0AA95EYS0_9BACL|nr:MAG: HAMP domain-containing sensor histidine kinase [Cohnella sp.]
MSIRLRLTLWYTSLFAVAFFAFGIIVYNSVYHNTISELRMRLEKVAADVKVNGSPNQYEYNLNSRAPGFNSAIIGIQLTSYAEAKTGYVIGKSNNMSISNLTFPFSPQDEVSGKPRFVQQQLGDEPFYIYEAPIMNKGTNDVIALLQVGIHTGGEQLLFSRLRTMLWLSGIIALLAAFLLGIFLSRKAIHPIGRVTEAAERIRSGTELGLRIPRGKTNDEIGRLTDTLNDMLSGLEKAYKNLEDSNIAQRRFVSDASHELRTPLTTIRGNVDLLEKIWADSSSDRENAYTQASELTAEEKRQLSMESIHDIADEARRMSHLVNDLLALARADAGYSVEMELLSLRSLAEEAARRAGFLPRKAEWIVGPLDALDNVWVKGNHDYLLQLLFIFIENGFKYTQAGEVRLYAVISGDFVGLSVSDTGMGMNQDEIPHIFDRFYRADVSRGETAGTGLGLSIAKWIAELHHATIDVRSQEQQGTTFTIWLPIIK